MLYKLLFCATKREDIALLQGVGSLHDIISRRPILYWTHSLCLLYWTVRSAWIKKHVKMDTLTSLSDLNLLGSM